MLGVFVLAFFFKRVNARGALYGVLVGEAVIFSCWNFTTIAFLWYNVIGCLVVLIAGVAISAVTTRTAKTSELDNLEAHNRPEDTWSIFGLEPPHACPPPSLTTLYPPRDLKYSHSAPYSTARIAPSQAIICSAAPAPSWSMRAPIAGTAIATDSMPAPPMIDISSAPPRGNCSDSTPIIVGEKYVLPMPKIVAAMNATTGLAPGRGRRARTIRRT